MGDSSENDFTDLHILDLYKKAAKMYEILLYVTVDTCWVDKDITQQKLETSRVM